MRECILLADSGSTKTDWMLADDKDGILEFQTQGINPVRDSKDAILGLLSAELPAHIPADAAVREIHFYGAGCIGEYSGKVADGLTALHPEARINVNSDLLGAAVALCGDTPGIVGILGTGSNSGYYDGTGITENVSPLGYILGDEGSGAVLGRTLVGMLLKGALPSALRDEFLSSRHLTPAGIIERVYRCPMPNKFLASLVPFIGEHRDVQGIHDMLVESFRLFFSRNVRAYKRPWMPVNLVGSIADIYRSEISEAADMEGFKLGKILRRPIKEMTIFHKKSLNRE